MTKRTSDSRSVLLLTEGTYPFESGGVSTWCDELCRSLDTVDFHVFALTGFPDARLRYTLPGNIREVRKLPLWSNKEPALWYQPQHSFTEVFLRRMGTGSSSVKRSFIPPFRALLGHIFRPEDAEQSVSEILAALYRHFQEHDYLETFRHEETWNTYRGVVEGQGTLDTGVPSLGEMTVTLKWLANFLLPLSATIPRTDCTHATAAGLCALPGIVASELYGTPMVVTDHGVYARERCLAHAQDDIPHFSKRFLTRLTLLVTRACYRAAEQISPVCAYNRRWEEALGADPARIRTIYNGIRTEKFVPGPKPEGTRDRPTVVALAQLFGLKDIETMIRSCEVVRRTVPGVQYRLYGSPEVDPAYTARCRRLIDELELENHFEIRGYRAEPENLYREGDLSVLSSISEGFPYAVLESMACGRPVVGTDVGGVREAIGDCGLVVPPRNPEALGRGIAELLCDEPRRRTLGEESRQRILEHFQLSRCVRDYAETYWRLATGRRRVDLETPLVRVATA